MMQPNWLAVGERTWWSWSPCAWESAAGGLGKRLRHREYSTGQMERTEGAVGAKKSRRNAGQFGAVDARWCSRCCDGVAVCWPSVDR